MKFSSMHIFFVLLYTPFIEMFAFGGKRLLCTLTQAALSPGLKEVRWALCVCLGTGFFMEVSERER